MNWFTRGVRNAFRNVTRTVALVVILGLSIGLALAMLIANHAVKDKINSVKSNVDNTISISPAGISGFSGGGNPLTASELTAVAKLPHVTALAETLSDRLTTSNTNLKSAITAGSLGQRFAQSGNFNGGGPVGTFGAGGSGTSFTPPITVNGTNDPTNLNASSATSGGGTFKLLSGSVFSSNSAADVALVGSSLASKNNLKVGSTFTAYSTTIKVVGTFSSGNTFGDNQLVMPLITVQHLTGETNDITSATAYIDSVSNLSSVTDKISKLLGSKADVVNSAQQAQTAVAPLQNIESISLYSLVGAVIAGAVIILMTMIMIVRERRREIGVIKAIGSSNARLVGQFSAEAVTLTVIGALIGIIVGALASSPITNTLVSNSSSSRGTSITPGGSGFASRGGFPGRGTTGFTFSRGSGGLFRRSFTTIHAVVGFGIIGDGIAVALVIALIGTGLATVFISRIRPAEVMRIE